MDAPVSNRRSYGSPWIASKFSLPINSLSSGTRAMFTDPGVAMAVIWTFPLVINGLIFCAEDLVTFPYQSTVWFAVFGEH